MSKLEDLMEAREANEKRVARESEKLREAAEKKAKRRSRLFERKEFNRLFKRLKTMVEGHWDRYGHGWKFKYKNEEYYVAYERWYSPKEPGDVDGYDMSGTHWILKRGFNGGSGYEYTLSHDSDPKQGLTEAVLRGLKELQDSRGRRWE